MRWARLRRMVGVATASSVCVIARILCSSFVRPLEKAQGFRWPSLVRAEARGITRVG
jgi:hypothetical protein